MANQSGNIYGLTILSPIKPDEPNAETSHNNQVRKYLASLPRNQRSPFSRISSTHFARLVVMDDVVYVGMPACEEHLQTGYLVFESNFDGNLDSYLERMVADAHDEVNAVWSHCTGYPGTAKVNDFKSYMKKCQIDTTFFFAAINDKTVDQTLRALQKQSALAAFIEDHQGQPAAELQSDFAQFLAALNAAPAPQPGHTTGAPPPLRVTTNMKWATRR